MSRRFLKPIIVLFGLALWLLLALPAIGNGAQVTRGEFVTYASGPSLGYEISGRAQMERTAAGPTLVQVHVTGLKPGISYGVHVHNLPCAVNDGGGHYQHIVGGPVDDANEIWPAFTTNPAGAGNGNAYHAFTARPEAQSIVIHDPTAANARIACADLQ
jgi:hypothetical protein